MRKMMIEVAWRDDGKGIDSISVEVEIDGDDLPPLPVQATLHTLLGYRPEPGVTRP